MVCDIGGILHPDRDDLDAERAEMAARTNPRGLRGRADDALAGADVVVGVSAPGRHHRRRRFARWPPDAIVFAMANPIPEVQPEEVWATSAIMATGRSDYPNQINNVLAFPGIFRGALDVRARGINEDMKLAAARAIAVGHPGERPRPRVHRRRASSTAGRARGGGGGGRRRRSRRAMARRDRPADGLSRRGV